MPICRWAKVDCSLPQGHRQQEDRFPVKVAHQADYLQFPALLAQYLALWGQLLVPPLHLGREPLVCRPLNRQPRAKIRGLPPSLDRMPGLCLPVERNLLLCLELLRILLIYHLPARRTRQRQPGREPLVNPYQLLLAVL